MRREPTPACATTATCTAWLDMLVLVLACACRTVSAAPPPPGQVLCLRSQSNGTNAQPRWLFPLLDWENEGAGPQTGQPMPPNSASAIDADGSRLFYLVNPATGSRHGNGGGFELAAFAAVTGKTAHTPFPNGGYLVGGSFAYAPSTGSIVALVGVGGNGTAIELGVWPTTGNGGVYTTRYTFPHHGYMDAFDYAHGFVAPDKNGRSVYWAFLLPVDSTEWRLFGIDVDLGTPVQPVATLKRAPGQCSGSTCLQPPSGFAPSVLRPGLAYGLDIDTNRSAGFQVTELTLATASMRPVGKIPPGLNVDLGFRFLATPWPGLPFGPADEVYYARLMGPTLPAIYGVNVTHGGVIVSKDRPWKTPADGDVPTFAHWLPTQP